jgi:rubrerythrin
MARQYNFFKDNDNGEFDSSMVEPFTEKAKSFSDKFKPSGLLNFFGGSTAPKVANKMLGNNKDDKKTRSKKDPLFSTISAGKLIPIKKDDSVTDVTAKLYNLLKHSYDRKVKNDEIENLFREHADREKERRHQELLKALGGFSVGKKGKKSPEGASPVAPEDPGSSWIDKAITAAKFIPSVVGGIGSFILAATPLLVLAEAAREADNADINDPEQGITEPLKKTYDKLADGDWEGALAAASKLNVFTAGAKTGLEFSKDANVTLGNVEKWDKRREENRNSEKEIATDKYRRPESMQKMIDTAKAEVASAKTPQSKKDAQAKLDSLIQSEEIQKKQIQTAKQVPSPTPATDRVNTGTQELKDREVAPSGVDVKTNNSTSVTGSSGGETVVASPSVRNQDESYKRSQVTSSVRP